MLEWGGVDYLAIYSVWFKKIIFGVFLLAQSPLCSHVFYKLRAVTAGFVLFAAFCEENLLSYVTMSRSGEDGTSLSILRSCALHV